MADRGSADATAPAGSAPSPVLPQRVYCTYFDANYLNRGLLLWQSLRAVSPQAALWICCLDAATFGTLERLALPGVRLFTLAELERHFPDLAAAKPTRSRVEYYFTCTPSVVRYVFDAAPDIAQLTYIDADLYFFADPEPLFEELAAAGGSVGIIAHRFSPRLRDRERYGLYNVGWLTFARDRRGLACLDDWRRNCVEWCYFREEDGKFADQKYLDQWASRFSGVVVLGHKGANVALWNLEGAAVSERGGRVLIDGEPLLFFHFHRLTAVRPWLFHTDAGAYGFDLDAEVQRLVYVPHLRHWREMTALARANSGAIDRVASQIASGGVRSRVMSLLRDMVRVMRQLATGRGEYLVLWPRLPAHLGAMLRSMLPRRGAAPAQAWHERGR